MYDFRRDAIIDAKEMAENFLAEIVEQLINENKASGDLYNQYGGGDRYHRETHVDKSYRLLEAAELLDELDEYEETDSGLWQGFGPREAITVQAAFTYGNAVYSMWRDIIEQINSNVDVREIEEQILAEDSQAGLEPDEDAVQEALKEKVEKAVKAEIESF